MSAQPPEGPETLQEEDSEARQKQSLVKRVWRWYNVASLVDNIRQMLQKPSRIPNIDLQLIIGKVIPLLAIIITLVWLILTLRAPRIQIVVTNNGCDPIFMRRSVLQNGLADYFIVLPDQVAKGAHEVVEINQLLGQVNYFIDASTPGTLIVSPSILNGEGIASQKFPVRFDDVVFDGDSLKGRKVSVNLVEGKTLHNLQIICGKA